MVFIKITECLTSEFLPVSRRAAPSLSDPRPVPNSNLVTEIDATRDKIVAAATCYVRHATADFPSGLECDGQYCTGPSSSSSLLFNLCFLKASRRAAPGCFSPYCEPECCIVGSVGSTEHIRATDD